MTDNINKNDADNILCCCCGKYFDIDGVHQGKIRLDGTVKMCKTCNWIFRHGGLPKTNLFTCDQMRTALEFILIGRSIYLNDLSDILEISLHDTVELVSLLNVGNKKYKIKTDCEYCGKQSEHNVSVYLSNKHLYCSAECYRLHKKIVADRGENCELYNRIKTNCNNCGVEINVTPYKYNKTNSFGERHNFCSQQCYWEYRSKHYVGEKSSRLHSVMPDEHKDKMRKAFIEWSKSENRFDTKIQITINSILDKNNISYKREYKAGYYAIDNFILNNNLAIEVMGDYWHASPILYSEYNLLNNTQKKDISKDKSKHTYIKNKYNREILYLWESDIENNSYMCECLILEYINNNGVLDNYHSFNWCYDDGKLRLNELIVVPYQDRNIEDCKAIFVA